MDESHNSDYQEGMRDGRLQAMEHRLDRHDEIKIDHEKRLVSLERIVAGFVAIVFLSTIWPGLEGMFNALSKQ
jgi:hypothetical protein